MGVGESCFEFGPTLGCGAATLSLPPRGGAAAGRGRLRSRPRGKFSSSRPGCLGSGPGRQRPFEPRLPPGRPASSTPRSKETTVIALLAWCGRTWQGLASGARGSRSRVRGRRGLRTGGPRTFHSLALALALASASTRSVSLLVLMPFLSASLSACVLCLPSAACLCTGWRVTFRMHV